MRVFLTSLSVSSVALCLLWSPHFAVAQNSTTTPEEKALTAGFESKEKRELSKAAEYFQKAIALAEPESSVYQSATDELEYHLPLMWAERFVLNQNWLAAEQKLNQLLQRYQDDEKRSRHLVDLIARLRASQQNQQQQTYVDPGQGRQALENVAQILQRFFQERQRFPRDYAELNNLLPANKYPLNEYDIVHYTSVGEAYGLTLRSKLNPENVLTLQRTGLVQ